MALNITTTVNHTAEHFSAAHNTHGSAIAEQTGAVMTSALRRIGSQSVEWSRRSGSYIDTSRLAFASYPDARMFGRVDSGNDSTPELGVMVLIDSSGSMCSACRCNGLNVSSRRHAARAVAVGIATAAQRLGLGCVIGHHGATSTQVNLAVHRDTRGVIHGADWNGNYDAWAVSDFLAGVAMPARRNLFVLISDGEPCGDRAQHLALAGSIVRQLNARGDRFVCAFIGDEKDTKGMRSASEDWGAQNVADCRADLGALSSTVIRAIASMRARA